MNLETSQATVVKYSQTYYWGLGFAFVFLMTGAMIPLAMSIFHVWTVSKSIMEGNWIGLLALFFLLFWGALLYGILWAVFNMVLSAPRCIFLSNEGVWIEALHRPNSYYLSWGDITEIHREVHASVTVHFYTGYKFYYLKQKYMLEESQRLINKKYRQTSKQLLTNRMKELSKPQFEQLLLTYYRRSKSSSIVFECQTIE